MGSIIVSDTSKHYELFERLGKGGVGAVFRAVCKEDGKTYAFKYFKPDPNDVQLMLVHNNIKKNIANLIKTPLKAVGGKELTSFIGPKDMISNVPGKGGFGYIMEFKDTSHCGSIFKSWKKPEQYKPDARATMEICIKIAEIFDRIHASGRCYKDVNEGNIYLDSQNNNVYIIDSDNIAPDGVKTIFGTLKYVAPEVYTTETPNTVSDRFSMATFFYRLMVGGYPLEGKKTVKYLMDNQLDDNDFISAKAAYADRALFAFDERDKSNTIRNVTEKYIPDDHKSSWKIQTVYWDLLPQSIRDMFLSVFSDHLLGEARDRRPSEKQWIRVFDSVLEKGLVKCKCGKYNYSGNKECIFCGKSIASLKVTPCPRNGAAATDFSVTVPVKQKCNSVKFKLLTGKGGEIVASQLDGNDACPSLFSRGQIILSVIDYNKTEKMMKCKNVSGFRFTLSHPNGKIINVVNGASVFLMKGSQLDLLIDGKAALKMSAIDFVAETD